MRPAGALPAPLLRAGRSAQRRRGIHRVERLSCASGNRCFGHLSLRPLPGGYAHPPLASESWCHRPHVLLSRLPQPASVSLRYEPARLVRASRLFHWCRIRETFIRSSQPGAGRKILYQDPVSQDTTWLLGTLPLRWGERAEVHPTIEEMYLISGETHGNRGVMRPGAYFWRPPEIPHGPYGTLTGNLYLFRTQGGGLSTRYVSAEQPFRWWPPYAPVVPEHLAAYAGEARRGRLLLVAPMKFRRQVHSIRRTTMRPGLSMSFGLPVV